MMKQDYKRINLWVDKDLYEEIKNQAQGSYLRVGTYVRQLVQQALNNNSIKNN